MNVIASYRQSGIRITGSHRCTTPEKVKVTKKATALEAI